MSQDASRSPPTPTDTPMGSLVPDSVNDMFDLAAPPVERALVARLVPADSPSSMEPIDIRSETEGRHGDVIFKLGRGKDIEPAFRLAGSPKLSSNHCELHLDPMTFVVRLKDVSTNGTFVNGDRIQKGTLVTLENGDRVSFWKTTEKGDTAGEFLFHRIKGVTTVTQLQEELTCGICRTVYLRPCTLVPCMHVFCASCISDWIKTKDHSAVPCPECRANVTEVRPTHKIQSCVEQFFSANPSLRRTPAEIADAERNDTIPPAGLQLGKQKRPRPDDEDPYDDGEYSDNSSNGGLDLGVDGMRNVGFVPGVHNPLHHTRNQCPRCTAPSTVDQYQCDQHHPAHLICRSCNFPFPERPLLSSTRPQRCHLCSAPFCFLYMKDETDDTPFAANKCVKRAEMMRAADPAIGTNCYSLYPLADRTFHKMPEKLFGGNVTEQSILSQYLAKEGLTVEGVWATCKEKWSEALERGATATTGSSAVSWIPDLVSVNGPLLPTSPVCIRCAETVFSALLFHFRRSIPRDKLDAAVADRPNCWYGIQCRTQFHKPQHAQNFNHICYQEKRKE
ncbi:zinc finger family protein [Angomonas deanei]|nr:zinc finger family protein [Angomonas deanei]|eukprot:EPY42539.1 zinc finger family protein [Angomonas deanei]